MTLPVVATVAEGPAASANLSNINGATSTALSIDNGGQSSTNLGDESKHVEIAGVDDGITSSGPAIQSSRPTTLSNLATGPSPANADRFYPSYDFQIEP